MVLPTVLLTEPSVPVLCAYERDHDLIILDPSEYDGLRTLCSQHADLELGPRELFNFLRYVSEVPKQRNLHFQHDTQAAKCPLFFAFPRNEHASLDLLTAFFLPRRPSDTYPGHPVESQAALGPDPLPF